MLLLTRLDSPPLQSFLWSPRAQGREDEIEALISDRRRCAHGGGAEIL